MCSSDLRENIDTVTIAQNISITELNGNENFGKGKVKKTGLPVDEALRTVKDTDKHKVLVETTGSDTIKADIVAQELNGNENFGDGKKVRTVNVAQLLGVQTKGDAPILVQTDKKPSVFLKQIKKLNASYKADAAKHNLSGDVALDRYMAGGPEFIAEFQQKHNIAPQYMTAIAFYQQQMNKSAQARNYKASNAQQETRV